MRSLRDDRGYNQIWEETPSTLVRAQRRCDYLISQMRPNPQKKVLEIGCGWGRMSHRLAEETGMQVVGIDLCDSFIQKAKQRYQLPNLCFARLDFLDIQTPLGGPFDYIVGNGVLHHLFGSLTPALLRMKALLRPGGRVAFLEPNLENPYVRLIFQVPLFRKMANLEPAEMAFSKKHITKLLSLAGYRTIRVEYKDFLLPGVPEILIHPLVWWGDRLEKIPLLRSFSQSIGISAEI